MSANLEKVKAIFLEAVERHAPEKWPSFLDGACGDDQDLRRHIEILLEVHASGGSLLDKGAIAAEVTLDQPLTERPNAQIGPYKLLQEIGHGGMGVVYMAEQTEPVRRKVALKIIKPGMDTRQVIARFEAERQALSLMDHPNIARVLDAGTTDSGRPYFVMELVKGQPITEYCDQQHLTPRQRLELYLSVCHAIQHAHQKGIIHRDVKPSNVLVAEYDGRPVAKVIDFGVAKATSQPLTEKTMFTGFGQIVGTLEYMSPEQARVNQLDIDTRSDIYSLGVLLYELLTGTTPFDKQRLRSAAWDEMLRIIREEEPPKPSTRLSESKDSLPSVSALRQTEPARLTRLVRGELDWIVMKALEKDRARRYETANGLAHDIQRYLNDEPVAAGPPSAVYRLKKTFRRNKTALSVMGLILILLILLGSVIGWSIRNRQAREQEIAWERESRQAKVSAQIELILEEAGRLEGEQKWPEAFEAAKRAEAVLASGEAPADVLAKAQTAVADLALVERLEAVRFRRGDFNEEGFEHDDANRRYAAVFREYGVDVDALQTDEAAARLRSRASVLPAFIVALDDWALHRRYIKNEGGEEVLTKLAEALDADPWRRRVREALAAKNDQTLEALAASQEMTRQAPATLGLLAWALVSCGKAERAVELLNQTLVKHPDEFWLHYCASFANGSCVPRRQDDESCHLKVALALRPRNVGLLVNLGEVLTHQAKSDQGKLKQGYLDEAIAYSRKAIDLEPQEGLAYLNLGEALENRGRLDEAVACYRKLIEVDPKNGYSRLGRVLMDQGKLGEAIACHRKALEFGADADWIHVRLGEALQAHGEFDEAGASFRRAIELNPNRASAHVGLGKILTLQGKLEEAINCFRKAVQLEPNNAWNHLHLGRSLKRVDPDEAVTRLRKAIELDPSFSTAHTELGYALKLQGKAQDAVAYGRTAVEFEPTSAALQTELGKTLVKERKLEDAINCFRKAIELDPNYAKAHANLGLALKDQGLADEAVSCLRKAVEIDPAWAAAHANLGIALMDQGTLDGAIASFRRALEIDPNISWCCNHLALCLATADDARLRNPQEALTLAKKTVQLDPSPHWHWNTLSVAAFRAGDWQTSLDARQEKLQRTPITAEDRLFLAMTHWQLGDRAEARKQYDEAVAQMTNKDEPNIKLDNLRQEAGQLLGIVSAPTPPKTQARHEAEAVEQANTSPQQPIPAAGPGPER